MNIYEAVKQAKRDKRWDETKVPITVNIGFMPRRDVYDETQFDLYEDYDRTRELEELWKDFCKENGLRPTCVLCVETVEYEDLY